MTATAIHIADALVTQLNAHPFSLAFVATRGYIPAYELREMGTLHVTVVPNALESEPISRSQDKEEHAVYVAVQQKLADTGLGISPELLDGLMALVEEIRDYLRDQRLATFPTARRKKAENKPIYDPKHLADLGLFTSLILFTYDVVR